jgi:putative salt-induced outer membrane protein YdiY
MFSPQQTFLNHILLKWTRAGATIVFRTIVAAAILLFSTLFFFRNSALADEVYLRNGDLLSGEILSTEDEQLIVETNYAKKIKVKFDKVVCVSSDKEVTLLLKNNDKLVGHVTCPTLGSIQLLNQETGESTEIAFADLKAINPPPPPPAVTYKALADLGGAINGGNTRSKTFNSSAKFQARSKNHRLYLEGKFNYGESEGEEDERNWLSGAKYDYFWTEKLYSYLRPFAEYDKFQDLDLRFITSAGPGYQFIDTETASLYAELGPAYFYEDYGTKEDNEYLAARWAAGVRYHIIPQKIVFFHLHEFYYDLSSDVGVYLRTEQGVRFALVENFSLNFRLDYQYKSDPPEGNKSSDTALVLALGYELNF